MPVEQLDLSVRALNCLKREGIHTLGKLMELSEQQLREIRDFGEKSVVEVQEKLREVLKPPPNAGGFESDLGLPPDGDGGLTGDREPRSPGPIAGPGAAAVQLPRSEPDD